MFGIIGNSNSGDSWSNHMTEAKNINYCSVLSDKWMFQIYNILIKIFRNYFFIFLLLFFRNEIIQGNLSAFYIFSSITGNLQKVVCRVIYHTIFGKIRTILTKAYFFNIIHNYHLFSSLTL